MVSHSHTLLSTNNSPLTEYSEGSSQQSLNRNMDASNQLSSDNSLQESALNSPAKVNLLNELLSKVKRVASDEHIQFNVSNDSMIKVSQKQVIKGGTLHEMVSSDVDGFDLRNKLSINKTKIDNCTSANLELETISSSVDKDSLNSKLSCCKIKNVMFNCVESEPPSSSVDAVDFINYTEINMTSLEKNDQSFITDIEDLASSAVLVMPSALEDITNDFVFQNELGQDETSYGAQFNKNSLENKLSIAVNDTSEISSTPEALTSAFKGQDEMKQETSQGIQLIENSFENKLWIAVNDTSIAVQKREIFYTPEAMTIALGFEDRLKELETSTNGFENRLEVTISESSISAQRKESLSEQTGMEISHSELPADVENSEAGFPAVMPDTGLKSNFEGSTSSSVPNLIKRQKHGLVKSLRQRQFVNSRMPADMENDQILSDQVSSTIDAQQLMASSVDEPHWDRQQLNQHGMRNIFLDQQNYLISATRSEQVNSLYSSSFMVMIGLCLTTIFIFWNHVHFLVDFSDYL